MQSEDTTAHTDGVFLWIALAGVTLLYRIAFPTLTWVLARFRVSVTFNKHSTQSTKRRHGVAQAKFKGDGWRLSLSWTLSRRRN